LARRATIESTTFVEFEVVDATGAVEVRDETPLLAAIPRPLDGAQITRALEQPALRQLFDDRVLADHRILGSDYLRFDRSGATLRAFERLLPPNSKVYACGEARAEVSPSGGEAGYRQAPSRVALAAPRNGPLVVADCSRTVLLDDLKRRLGCQSE
jgi:hypothetical protein